MQVQQNDNLYCQLRQIIDETKPGDKLPSLRELSRRLGVSVSVADRYLARIVASGEVLIKPRSGAYRAFPAKRKIEILVMNPTSLQAEVNFHYFFFSTLVTSLVSSGRQVRIHDMQNEINEIQLDSIGNPDDSIIITYRLQWKQLPVIDFLQKKKIPMLHILPNFKDAPEPLLQINDFELVRKQVEHLLAHGHIRIAYFHAAESFNFSRAWDNRLKSFYQLALEKKLEISSDYIIDVGAHCERAVEAVEQLYACSPRPTALIIYDEHVKMVNDALRQKQFPLAVMATDGMPWNSKLSPSVTSTCINFRNLNTILEELITKLENHQPLNEYFLPIDILPGETV